MSESLTLGQARERRATESGALPSWRIVANHTPTSKKRERDARTGDLLFDMRRCSSPLCAANALTERLTRACRRRCGRLALVGRECHRLHDRGE